MSGSKPPKSGPPPSKGASSSTPKKSAKKGNVSSSRGGDSSGRRMNPFHRARADHLQETAEDYVELIAELIEDRGEARVTDMAKRLGISNVTVTKTVSRLQKAGYVHSEPYRAVFLTAEGEQLAAHCRERHELVFEFLKRLGVPPEIAAQDAEGMEHHASAETLERMRAFLSDA
jgi:DtxR family manganese transport transcriptional regulator